MYELLAGSLPFTGETPYAIILQHQNEEPADLPSTIDPEFASIVAKAMGKDVEDRFQSAREMAQVIRNWLREQTDDGLGTDSRETPSLGERRPRRTTPGHHNETPAEGIPTPGRPDTDERVRPDISRDDDAPPVQILTRPQRTSKKSAGQEEDAPSKKTSSSTSRTPAPREEIDEDILARTSPESEESSSIVATLITTIAILVILAAIAWTIYDMMQ